VVYDSLRHRYTVSNWGDGTIVQIDNVGQQSYFSTLLQQGEYHLAGLYIHGDTLLVAAGDAPDPGIAAFDIETGELPSSVIIPGIGLPNGITRDSDRIMYDETGNRLLLLSVMGPGSRVLAINLSDSTLSTVVTTGLSVTDGITMDTEGRYYTSEWIGDTVRRYNHDFSGQPETFSTGHDDPADINYDRVNDS